MTTVRQPDRVVIGCEDVRTAEIMKELYSPFVRTGKPILTMDVSSAEMTKYAANAMLATKISFMNDIQPPGRTRKKLVTEGVWG
jgi:UDPglucose 6-dehydrogenase